MDFALYDVFSDGPFSGNQAAVIRSEGPLTSDKLLILAKEFNLPETCVYWMANDVPHMTFATSENPINTCGHGLLAVLADVVRTVGSAKSGNMCYCVETCGSGSWRFTVKGERSMYVSVRWPKLPTLFKKLPAVETAQLLGIKVDEIRKGLPLEAFDSGIINGLVPLSDQQQLATLKPDFGQNMKNYFAKHWLDDLELYWLAEEQVTGSSRLNVRARNIFPYGVREEGATGSASVSLAAALFGHSERPDLHISVTQGLSRQGNIVARIVGRPETRAAAWLEGRVDFIASGTDLVAPG